MKRKESTELEQLKKYMFENVNEGASVADWNAARKEAKTLFSEEAIGQLDASGYIKAARLYIPSAY